MSQKKAKKRRIDIDKLSLGMEMATGRIVVGEALPDGSIPEDKAVDVTDQFVSLMQTIAFLQAKKAEQDKLKKDQEEVAIDQKPREENLEDTSKKGPKIFIPTASEIAAAGKMMRKEKL